MKKLNQKGFTGFEIALLVLVLAALGFAGYTVWQKNKPDNQSQTSQTTEKKSKTDKSEKESESHGKIVFEGMTSLDPAEKQKILSQIAEPLLFYYEEVLKIELKEVKIEKSTNIASSADARFMLSYPYKVSDGGSDPGFIFGYNNKIEFWQPGLCDHGGCKEYPAELKNKFPENYSNFLACKAANDAGDKEKANSIGCLSV